MGNHGTVLKRVASWTDTYFTSITNLLIIDCSCSAAHSCPTLQTPWTADCQASLQASLFPGVCSHSCPFSWWCHLIISSSVAPFCCLQSFPAQGSFPTSQLFTSGGHNTETSASASVLPMNIPGWFPLGLTGLISLLSKGLSSVSSSTKLVQINVVEKALLWQESIDFYNFHVGHTKLLQLNTPFSFSFGWLSNCSS